MPIEFRCSQCNQLLRVPDDSAGKGARCPKCQALMTVPGGNIPPFAAPPFAPLSPSGGGAPPPEKPPQGNPFGEAAGRSPFGELGSGQAIPNLNPYAPPASPAAQQNPFAVKNPPINPQRVSFEAVFNQAWQVWQSNLGILVGITVTVMAVQYAVAIPFTILSAVLEQNREAAAAAGARVLGQLITNALQLYLSIGQAQILLKLVRRQPANFSELFGGGALFWPVLGASLLGGVVIVLGFMLLIVPGVILALMYWPFRLLIIDQKLGVIESFSKAAEITNGNWGTAFVLSLASFGIILLGCAAVCVGVLFAAPLVATIWVVAYLMMAGQIPAQQAFPQYPQWNASGS